MHFALDFRAANGYIIVKMEMVRTGGKVAALFV